MTKIPPDDILESLYNLRISESDQLKTVLELYNMEIHQKKAEFEKGIDRRLEEEEVSVTSGKKKASVRMETDAVSNTKPKIVRKNQNTLQPHLLSQPHHEVEVCRGREASEAKVTMDPFSDNRADIIWEVLVRERLVNIGMKRVGQRDGVPKTWPEQAAAVPNLHVCKHLCSLGVAHAGEYCLVGVAIPPKVAKKGEPGCPQG